RGYAVEINTRFLYRDYPEDLKKKFLDANRRLIRKAKAKGVGIAIGSDAHSPKDQGAGFAQIIKVLDEARINELVFPIGGRLARVALRATKEHLERRAAVSVSQPVGSSITGFGRAELAELETTAPRRGGPKRTSATARRAKSTSKRAAKKSARNAKPAARKAAARKPARKAAKGASRRGPATRRPAKKAARKRPAQRVKKSAPKRHVKKKTAPKKPTRGSAKSKPAKRPAAKKTAKKKTPRRR
ncbi:MAG: hypothetical protein JO135_08475, partial [Candidatus Eremiobacteraeota bacterium]|nr:hypothetical protein [Candidatus Eremiobacteraeota bacterium]